MPRSAAPAPADARRVSLSWLQHAEAATVDDDHRLRLSDGDEEGINGRVADLRLREADLARVAADVGRRSFARSPLSGAPSNNRAPVLSRTNPSVSDSSCSSPRTTSISPTSRTPSPPPPRTLTRSSSSPLKLYHHAPVARRLLLPDGRCGEPPRSRRLGAVSWRAIRTAVGEDLIDDLALFLELHEGE